jgi:hypothetical protein
LITARSQNSKALFKAAEKAKTSLEANDWSSLGLKSIVQIAKEEYPSIANPPDTSR